MARRLLWAIPVLMLLAAAGYGMWLYQYSTRHVWTDDASVEGALFIVSSRVPGPVLRVHVQDNERVRAGQLLAEIDPRDYEIRLEQARAAVRVAEAEERGARAEVPLSRDSSAARVVQMAASLAAARVEVDSARARVAEARARLRARDAAVQVAQAEKTRSEATLEKAHSDLERTTQLIARELIARQDHDRARIGYRAAAAEVEAAERRLAQSERESDEVRADVAARDLAVQQAERRVEEAAALLSQAESNQGEVPVKEAQVGRMVAALQQARADLAAAELQLAKSLIRAPADGVVAKKTVEPGQMVQVGQPLMALVPLDGVWVLANFKETQLARVRPGLGATVRVDMFPDRVFAGVVDSISAGTGARFSVLPPENATGNWVKVVQRIPVKILLPGYKAEPPLLRPGMSVSVTVALEPDAHAPQARGDRSLPELGSVSEAGPPGGDRARSGSGGRR